MTHEKRQKLIVELQNQIFNRDHTRSVPNPDGNFVESRIAFEMNDPETREHLLKERNEQDAYLSMIREAKEEKRQNAALQKALQKAWKDRSGAGRSDRTTNN